MNLHRRAGALAALTVCLAILVAPGHGAAKARPECPPDSLCVWTKANYEGDRLVLDKLGLSNKISRVMDNKVTSVRLRYSGGAAQLYEHPNGEGDTLCLLDAPGLRKSPDLSQTGGGPTGYDNMVSSSYLSAKPFGTCF
jgi:hypothetical protein